MPFTVSHIAAILPFHKSLRRLGLLSAAAIGAMSPDMDLILPSRLARVQTHGRLALLTFCLPVGLAVWVLFQTLIKPALIEVLPDPVYVRLCTEHLGARLKSLAAWLYATVAVLFGAVTHIIWDGFTHDDGSTGHILSVFGVVRNPELGISASQMYRWIQHASTVLGLAGVIAALWLWIHHTKQPQSLPERRLPVRERNRWLLACIAIPVLLVATEVAHTQYNGWPHIYSTAAITQFAVTGTYGAILALVFTSALIRRRLLILEARRPEPDA